MKVEELGAVLNGAGVEVDEEKLADISKKINEGHINPLLNKKQQKADPIVETVQVADPRIDELVGMVGTLTKELNDTKQATLTEQKKEAFINKAKNSGVGEAAINVLVKQGNFDLEEEDLAVFANTTNSTPPATGDNEKSPELSEEEEFLKQLNL